MFQRDKQTASQPSSSLDWIHLLHSDLHLMLLTGTLLRALIGTPLRASIRAPPLSGGAPAPRSRVFLRVQC